MRELQFQMNEVHNYPAHYEKLGETDASPDMVQSILEEAAKFTESEVHPLYQAGDAGCTFQDGEVTTPPGWKELYQAYAEAGWCGLAMEEEYGGQNLPASLALAVMEMTATANWAWNMYPGLSRGAMETIKLHATEELKEMYLPNMVSGAWTGVMDLTESQAGTDLNQVKTKATPQDDGSFKISGEKIFISCGEHDMAENIIHVVLARLPGAPPGTRGISLFLVPKYVVKPDGSMDTSKKNCVTTSIEHKMGIKGSATSVVLFDESVGYLIGKENQGLKSMFTFMNGARLGTGMQGIGTMELALQNSTPYARERMSMRALSGAKEKDKAGDRIIHHPDVRRMLLTQKAFVEGGRALFYRVGKMADQFQRAPDEAARDKIEHEMGLYTPVLKGFLTEMSQECAYDAQQVYGGHGYIKEWGMEQIARDARISTMYEGTTGVQALDLIGRKVLMTKPPMGLLLGYCKEVLGFCAGHATNPAMWQFVGPLARATMRWVYLTTRIMVTAARGDKEIVGAASVDYLKYSGYVMLAHQWALQADVASKKLASASDDEKEFYTSKVQTAEFYFKCILPRINTHAATMLAGSKVDMQMNEEWICKV
jgi:alkylation response protein AidB-like acyl-CoA dehydrogenase